MERVMLFNACEVVPPNGGRIEISSRNSEPGIQIRVADNGPGIPEAIRENLFQPFASHGKENRIGLGLTVVQKIMRDHGGDVRVQSTGRPARYSGLHFPVAIEAAAPAGAK